MHVLCRSSQHVRAACRDLVLETCASDPSRHYAPPELRLRHLTELTRLVLKGYRSHLTVEDWHEGRPGLKP